MAGPGRTAVVTGIARPSGIGQACARLLFKQGYNIIGIDTERPTYSEGSPWLQDQLPSSVSVAARDQAAANTAAATASATVTPAPTFTWLDVDLSQPDKILSLQTLMSNLGVQAVHVLVNNAGIADPYMQSDSLQERASLWSKYISVNLSAPFLLSEALLPLMPPRESSIIHISSTRALQSEPHCEGYGAAKAGLLGLTHAQAASLATKGIRVNAVCPGWIDTSGEAAAASSITPEQHEWHWTGKVGSPDDIAELVCFLADNCKSGFISGQHFVVDGGVTKKMVYPEE